MILRHTLGAVSGLAVMALAGCQQPASSAASVASIASTAPSQTESTSSSAPGVSLSDARIRAPLGGKTITAGYVSINNNAATPDRLIAATSPAFSRIELHSSSKDAAGMMKMDKLEAIDVPANGSAVMAPGGLHMMMFDIGKPLTTGAAIPVTLTFEKAGKVEKSFTVVENPVVQQGGSAAKDEHAGH